MTFCYPEGPTTPAAREVFDALLMSRSVWRQGAWCVTPFVKTLMGRLESGRGYLTPAEFEAVLRMPELTPTVVERVPVGTLTPDALALARDLDAHMFPADDLLPRYARQASNHLRLLARHLQAGGASDVFAPRGDAATLIHDRVDPDHEPWADGPVFYDFSGESEGMGHADRY